MFKRTRTTGEVAVNTPGRMKLYCSKTSPYSRKVRVALIELGLDGLTDEIVTDPFNPAPELLGANPLSRIPTLITEKGEALPDSTLIMDYLQSRAHGLLPLPRGAKRWSTLRRQVIAEGIIDAAVATVLEKRRPESIVYMQFLDRQAATIRRCVEMLNVDADLLSRDTPGFLEITVGVALAYLDLRMPYLEWRKNHDALVAWQDAFAARPSMMNTAPPAG